MNCRLQKICRRKPNTIFSVSLRHLSIVGQVITFAWIWDGNRFAATTLPCCAICQCSVSGCAFVNSAAAHSQSFFSTSAIIQVHQLAVALRIAAHAWLLHTGRLSLLVQFSENTLHEGNSIALRQHLLHTGKLQNFVDFLSDASSLARLNPWHVVEAVALPLLLWK
jgi:hypothetical protein